MKKKVTRLIYMYYIHTIVPWRKKLHSTEGWTNIDLNPRNKSWAVPKQKHNHPSFDWMKANSFHVKTSVTDGNEVIPKITAKPKQIAPINDYIICSSHLEIQN